MARAVTDNTMFPVSKQVANKVQISKIPNSIGGHIDYTSITVNYGLRKYNVFLLSDYWIRSTLFLNYLHIKCWLQQGWVLSEPMCLCRFKFNFSSRSDASLVRWRDVVAARMRWRDSQVAGCQTNCGWAQSPRGVEVSTGGPARHVSLGERSACSTLPCPAGRRRSRNVFSCVADSAVVGACHTTHKWTTFNIKHLRIHFSKHYTIVGYNENRRLLKYVIPFLRTSSKAYNCLRFQV